MVFMMNNPNESRKKSRPFLKLALLLLAVSPLSNAAEKTESWNLSADFSTGKNPNGPWFYGFSAYGGQTLTPMPAAKDVLAVPGLNGWAVEAGTFPLWIVGHRGAERYDRRRNPSAIRIPVKRANRRISFRRGPLLFQHSEAPRKPRNRSGPEILLRNLLNHAASGLNQPPTVLPADFDEQLKAIGYQ